MLDFYHLPNISRYENLSLLSLSERCDALESQVQQIAALLPPDQRQVIEDYIHIRNDLDVETLKTALRWGKQHYY